MDREKVRAAILVMLRRMAAKYAAKPGNYAGYRIARIAAREARGVR